MNIKLIENLYEELLKYDETELNSLIRLLKDDKKSLI